MNQPSDLIDRLTPNLFWDVDPGILDVNKHASFIVDRVLSLGTLEDFKAVKAFYGKNRISNIVVNLRYVDERVLYFCSAYFNIPLNEFRCYNTRQLNLSHWNY